MLAESSPLTWTAGDYATQNSKRLTTNVSNAINTTTSPGPASIPQPVDGHDNTRGQAHHQHQPYRQPGFQASEIARQSQLQVLQVRLRRQVLVRAFQPSQPLRVGGQRLPRKPLLGRL